MADIYGTDPTDMAESIASEALRPPTPASSTGSRSSVGTSGQSEYSETGEVKVISNKRDSRADSKGN